MSILVQTKNSYWSLEKVVALVNNLADALDHLHNYTDDTGNKKSFIHLNSGLKLFYGEHMNSPN